MNNKVCIKCGEEKPATREYFYANKRNRDGLFSACKVCHDERTTQWRQANKEKIAEYNKQYHQANQEKVAERKKQYRQANKEKLLERSRQYHQENKEKVAERKKQYVRNLPAGIYQIINKHNERVYIGCSTATQRRFRSHKSQLRKNKHANKHLQEDYNKYGLDAFEFKVVEGYDCDTPFEVLEEREQTLILESHLDGKKIYNINVKIGGLNNG
mgnify:CR=1 FL=1